MALSATVYVFDIRLADADRQIYESLSLRVAKHPSETAEYLLARVLAYCLEYAPGITFSTSGLSDPDSPALSIRDLTGALQSWIEIGAPDATRLHKASKATPRVVVYCHKDVEAVVTKLRGERIHRVESIEINGLDRELLATLAAKLTRRMQFDLSIAERTLYITLGDDTFTGNIELLRLTT